MATREDGKSDGQAICEKINQDMEKRIVLLYATLQCEKRSSGFLSFKRFSFKTDIDIPMPITCKNGKHISEELLPKENRENRNEEKEHEERSKVDIREKLILSTEKASVVMSTSKP